MYELIREMVKAARCSLSRSFGRPKTVGVAGVTTRES